jgi:hypothetical protein
LAAALEDVDVAGREVDGAGGAGRTVDNPGVVEDGMGVDEEGRGADCCTRELISLYWFVRPSSSSDSEGMTLDGSPLL